MTRLAGLRLFAAAQAARWQVHNPHTGKSVVAAVQATNGRVYGGANVEGRSGTTVHAEKAAVLAGISDGQRGKWVVAVYVEGARPCGGCRQFLSEFATPDTPVAFDAVETTLGALLPWAP